MAIYLARAGAKVCLVSRTLEQLEAVAEEITTEGNEALTVVADVTTRQDVEASVDQAERAYGPVSILVNNAGLDEINESAGVRNHTI